MSLSSHLRSVYQLGYVTRDMDAAIDHLSQGIGAGSFFRLESARTVKLWGEDVAMRMLVALVNAGDRQIEIIQPVEGVVDFYLEGFDFARSPVALHHLGVLVEEDWAALRRTIAASGHETALDGGDPAFVRFLYADTRRSLGHYLEFLLLSEQAKRWNAALPQIDG